MYQFEEKSEWLKNLEEELHEDLEGLEDESECHDNIYRKLWLGAEQLELKPIVKNNKNARLFEEEEAEDLKDLEDESEWLQEGGIYKVNRKKKLTDWDVIAIGNQEVAASSRRLRSPELQKKLQAESIRNIETVRSAWNYPGRAPRYHYKMQNKLRKEWPVLAAALDRL